MTVSCPVTRWARLMSMKDRGCPVSPFRSASAGLSLHINPLPPFLTFPDGAVQIAVPVAIETSRPIQLLGFRLCVAGTPALFRLAVDSTDACVFGGRPVLNEHVLRPLPKRISLSGYLVFQGLEPLPCVQWGSQLVGEVWLGDAEDVYGAQFVLVDKTLEPGSDEEFPFEGFI